MMSPFTELLNRIHVKEKSEALSHQDKAFLSQTITDPAHCPKDILHVFATNKLVDAHNSGTLVVFHSEIIKIDADDYKKEILKLVEWQDKLYRSVVPQKSYLTQ